MEMHHWRKNIIKERFNKKQQKINKINEIDKYISKYINILEKIIL